MKSPDHELIERLLHEEESVALDFKRDQYEFDGADKKTKSELLKDILAFANTSRNSNAYILIGVQEVPGQRCTVVGVCNHLDDANLQQFVNHKTNRSVNFQYRQISFQGVELGLLEIFDQEPPLFVHGTYGKVARHAVYIRRGSATDTASPDEIVNMPRMSTGSHPIDSPQLYLEWADLKKKTPLSSSIDVKSLVLDPKLPGDTFEIKPRYSTERSGLLSIRIPDYIFNMDINQEYSREIISYSSDAALLTPVGLVVRNVSGTVARRVVFKGSIAKFDGLSIRDGIYKPSRSRDFYMTSALSYLHHDGSSPEVSEYGEQWTVEIDFGDIRPRDETWLSDPILFGSKEPGSLRLEGSLFGDNIIDPISCVLEIQFTVERRGMCISDVEQHLTEDWDQPA